MRAKIKELEAIANGDPFMLFQLILMLLFENNDNYQVQISGVGKTLEKLDQLGGEAARLGLLFQEICQRAKTDTNPPDFRQTYDLISQFMNGTKNFCEQFKADPRIASSFADLTEAFDHLFSSDNAKGIPTSYKNDKGEEVILWKRPDGTTGTIGDHFRAAQGLEDSHLVTFTQVFCKLFCPGKIDPKLIDPQTNLPKAPDPGTHYAKISADIQAFTKAPLNMNSTLTVKMEDIKSTAEQFGAMITKFAKEPNDLIHRMLERIQK